MTPPALELVGVERRYRDGPTIGPISLSVRKGEFASLLGPSGCGKTTILRAIAGFENVDHGEIRVGGRDITRQPGASPRHRTGVPKLYGAVSAYLPTVFANVAFGLRLRRMARAEIRTRATEALELVGLGTFESRLPSQLSGGQQQRVAIARSLVLRPELLLLDEPLSNLDTKLRLQMRHELRALQQRLAMTFVYVTHDQSEALALSDSVIVLSQGHLEQQGAPEEIYHQPKTKFVADFIGSANLLSATIIAATPSGHMVAELATGQSVTGRPLGQFRCGDRVWLCVRPEQLRSATAASSHMNVLTARPVHTTFQGDRIEVRFTVSGVQNAAAASPAFLFYAESARDLADEMSICFDPDAAIFLGAAVP